MGRQRSHDAFKSPSAADTLYCTTPVRTLVSGMHSESSSFFKLFRVLFLKIFLRWRSLHLPHSFQLSRPAPPSFLSLPDRYEQMFTPQLRSRYWLRRRRRRNDKSFRKWRRACDTRVERGRRRHSVAAPFSLTHSSLSRESGEVSVRGTRQKEGTSVRNLSLSQSNISVR